MTDAPTPEASWSDMIERTIAIRVARAVAEERIRLSATLRSVEERSYQRGYAKALEDADAVLAASLASLARSMSTPPTTGNGSAGPSTARLRNALAWIQLRAAMMSRMRTGRIRIGRTSTPSASVSGALRRQR